MAVTQYIGARYVPLFADPAEWNSTREYEPLTVVLYQGASYTSRQAVPIGIDISNDDFWVRTADYNAQVNQYRQEVQTFDSRITANATAISNEVSARETAISDEAMARANADDAIDGRIDTIDTAISDEVSARETAISNETSARTAADTALDARITANATAISDEVSARETADNTLDGKIDTETTARIAADDALSDRINDIVIQSVGTLPSYRDTNCLIFGDSFTDPNVAYSEMGYWPNVIASTFGFNVFNYAISGSGIVHGNGNLLTAVTSAINEMTDAEKSNTSVVIMYYGYNDLSNNVPNANIIENFSIFVQRISANYPNARIIAIPFNYGSGLLSSTREVKITSIIASMRDVSSGFPVEIVDNARYWLLGQFQWFKDSVHPNTNGYKQIASYITNAILGSPTRVIRCGNVDIAAGVEAYRLCSWQQQDGIVDVYARYVPSAATSTPTTTELISAENLPPIMVPEVLIQTPVNGVNATGMFTLSSLLRAYQYTVPNANTALIFTTSFRAAANAAWHA